MESFRSEVVTWRCLRHPNIVPFLGVSSVFPVCLVSQWMAEGTLLAFLSRNSLEHRGRYVRSLHTETLQDRAETAALRSYTSYKASSTCMT
jgi:hypothetical protein